MHRFAAAQARVNRACIRHLADASAVLGGSEIGVIYNDAYISPLGVASSQPVALAQAADVPAQAVGMPLQITAGSGVGLWRIEDVQPDGAGMIALHLEAA